MVIYGQLIVMRIPALLAVLAIAATSCGGGGTETANASAPSFVEQGAGTAEQDLLPTSTVAADAGAGGFSEAEGGEELTETTLPQNEQSQSENVDDLFTAMRVFNTCLEDEGRPFIGFDPDAPDDDPRRDPVYIEALVKCAALSQIQEAMASADLGSEGKTPEEIEEQNRGMLSFQNCLKGRGWDVPDSVPDENGLLQLGQDLGAPEGENILDSDDMNDCRIAGQAELEEEEG